MWQAPWDPKHPRPHEARTVPEENRLSHCFAQSPEKVPHLSRDKLQEPQAGTDYITSTAPGSRPLLAPSYVLGYSRFVLTPAGYCQSPLPGYPAFPLPCLLIPPGLYLHWIKSPRDNTASTFWFLILFQPTHLFLCSFSQQTLTVPDCKYTHVLVFRDLMRDETGRTWACTGPHSKGQMVAATYKYLWCGWHQGIHGRSR